MQVCPAGMIVPAMQVPGSAVNSCALWRLALASCVASPLASPYTLYRARIDSGVYIAGVSGTWAGSPWAVNVTPAPQSTVVPTPATPHW